MTRPSLTDLWTWPPTIPLHDPGGGPDVASALGIGRSAVYEFAARGDLPVLRLGRRVFMPTPALLNLLGMNSSTQSEGRE